MPASSSGAAHAAISRCGTYRYTLTRRWDEVGTTALWILHNPSTADGAVDDPTVRRCIAFSKAWGHSGISVVNLFALRARDPGEVARHPHPAGPLNRQHLRAAIRDHVVCVAAWGAGATATADGDAMVNWVIKAALAQRRELLSLGTTKDGHPRHPLYVPASQPSIRWATSLLDRSC